MKTLSRVVAKRRRRIVGLMSGTSADGVDAALVEVETLPTRTGPGPGPLHWELLDFLTLPYDPAVRAEILAVQAGGDHVLERLTRLHFLLGHLFADAVEKIIEDAGVPGSSVDAVASHGQTVCHLPGSTLQIGEPAVIAERTGICVISNFRSRDMAAGGTGAPLVPLVDHLLFADPDRARMALNVGGIANVTAIPAGGEPERVIAFDTGPGNMVMDALMDHLTEGKKTVDRGGALARKGKPDQELVESVLQEAFFAQPPPRAAGREQFGSAFTRDFLDRCAGRDLSRASILSTATWLTARAVRDAYERFVKPSFEVRELVVSGGGAHNVTLLEYLSELFGGISVVTSDYYGMDVDAKEATAFALLGHRSLEGEPGNLPAVTGAARAVVLGTLTPGNESR